MIIRTWYVSLAMQRAAGLLETVIGGKGKGKGKSKLSKGKDGKGKGKVKGLMCSQFASLFPQLAEPVTLIAQQQIEKEVHITFCPEFVDAGVSE